MSSVVRYPHFVKTFRSLAFNVDLNNVSGTLVSTKLCSALVKSFLKDSDLLDGAIEDDRERQDGFIIHGLALLR